MNAHQRAASELDSELLALFADDPEGLAIIDAIAATQRPRALGRHRRLIGFVGVAAALSVVVIGAFFFVGSSQAGVVERALELVDRQPVAHVALVDERPFGRLVNLQTGQSSTLQHRLDEWYDHRRGIRRLRDQVGAVVVADGQSHVRRGGLADSFIETYRSVLARRAVQQVTRGTYRGHSVYWLEFRARANHVRVAVSEHAYQPVALEFGGRHFRVIDFSGLSAIPKPRAAAPAAPRVDEPAIAEGVVAALQTVRLPPLRRVWRPLSRTLELLYASKPVHARLFGRYLRVRFLSGSEVSRLPAIERTLPRNSLLVFAGSPTHAFARAGDSRLALTTNLASPTVVAVGQALLER